MKHVGVGRGNMPGMSRFGLEWSGKIFLSISEVKRFLCHI